MSFRTTSVAHNVTSLQPEYVRRRQATPHGEPVFRFSVPVLRVHDVAATIMWYRKHLGFSAEAFPESGAPEFAILERDGVQILVRRAIGAGRAPRETHSGWDLYIWVDGVDLSA